MFTGRRHECLADCGLLRMAVIGQKRTLEIRKCSTRSDTHSRCPLEVRPSFVRRPGKAVQRLVTGGNVDVHGLRAHSSHLFQITGVHRLNRRVDDRGGIDDAPPIRATLSAGRCSCRFAGRFHACSASRRSRCPARWPRSASNCLLRVSVPQSFLLSGSRRAPLAPSVS